MKTLLTISLLTLTGIAAADPALVKKASPYSAKETMDRFENIVKKKGLTIFARIDHKANAKKAELNMNPAEVLIFGNPKIGTRIMNRDPAAALDLPLRVLAYTDDDGKTWLMYHDPETMKNLYQLEECVAVDKVRGALDKLTSAAVAK